MGKKKRKSLVVLGLMLVVAITSWASYHWLMQTPEPRNLDEFSNRWQAASISERQDLLSWLVNTDLERHATYEPNTTRLNLMSHSEVLKLLGEPYKKWGEEAPYPTLLYDVSGIDKWSDPIGNFIVPFQDYVLFHFDDTGQIESIELIS